MIIIDKKKIGRSMTIDKKNDICATDAKILYIIWKNIIMSNHISGNVDALVCYGVREKVGIDIDFKNFIKFGLRNNTSEK